MDHIELFRIISFWIWIYTLFSSSASRQ